MKLWRLLNILSEEKSIYDTYFSKYTDFQLDAPEDVILQALADSKIKFYVNNDRILRLVKTEDNNLARLKILNILEAYKIFGGEALNEVIDYGSYRLTSEDNNPEELNKNNLL